MDVGIRLPAWLAADRFAVEVRRVEDLGFDAAWIPDSQLLWRDAFVTAALAAVTTSSIRIGVAVTNTVTRHPSVVASAGRTIAELADGRFVLGLGVGNSSVRPVGLKPAPILEFEQRVRCIKGLLAGDEQDFAPDRRGRLHGELSGCPVYLAASGPRALDLAGRVADGVILLGGVAPDLLHANVLKVHAGAEAAGRVREDVQVVAATFCRVTDEVERDARELKPVCLTIAQNGGAATLARAGIDLGETPQVVDVYPDLIHAEDWGVAVERSGRWVSDEDAVAFATTFCLYGSPDEIVQKIEAARGAGASALLLQHVGSYSFPTEMAEAVAAHVLPRVRRPASSAT
jgi:5,10-methylenetetrahydromethanopterin reductase